MFIWNDQGACLVIWRSDEIKERCYGTSEGLLNKENKGGAGVALKH